MGGRGRAGAVVNVLDARLLAQLGVAQASGEPFVVPQRGFTLEQQSKPFGVTEAASLTGSLDGDEGLGHAVEAEGVEAVEGRMGEQGMGAGRGRVTRATSSRNTGRDRLGTGGRLQIGIVGEIISERWATSSGIRKLTVLTDTDCSVMRESFGRCSALLHSQPGEINPRLAAPSVIEAEIDALEKWIADIRARQEKAA